MHQTFIDIPRNIAGFRLKCIYDTLYAQLRAYLFVIKCKVFKMRGEGIQRIQFPDKKRHNELSDGGMRKFHLVSKVNNEKSASSSRVIAAAASEPEANERGSSLISRRLHYRGLQSLFLTKRKEFWLCANRRFRMRSGMRKELCERKHFRMRSDMVQGTVVMRQWMI